MRVLVACEFSGVVREAFCRLGHDAYSCDLRRGWPPTSGRHIRGDVRPLLREKWDLVIAHPPCTHLCNSGVRWLHERRQYDQLLEAAQFFVECLQANSPRVCVENPVMHRHARGMVGYRPSQLIQPWMFGHGETKATYLWLRGLPKLKPTKVVGGRAARIHRLSGRNRSTIRSVTYQGVAEAMAAQWAVTVDNRLEIPRQQWRHL